MKSFFDSAFFDYLIFAPTDVPDLRSCFDRIYSRFSFNVLDTSITDKAKSKLFSWIIFLLAIKFVVLGS